MSDPKLGETITVDFTTHAPSTGQVTDDDATPTVEVFEDVTDTPILTPTAVKRTSKTGNYRVQIVATAGNGFEVGKSYNVVATATVGGVSGKDRIFWFILRSREIGDLNTVVPDAAGTAASLIAGLNDPSAAAIVTAIFAATGITGAGTATFAEVLAKLLAHATWNFELSGTNLLLYDDDNSTVLATIPLQAAGPRG